MSLKKCAVTTAFVFLEIICPCTFPAIDRISTIKLLSQMKHATKISVENHCLHLTRNRYAVFMACRCWGQGKWTVLNSAVFQLHFRTP